MYTEVIDLTLFTFSISFYLLYHIYVIYVTLHTPMKSNLGINIFFRKIWVKSSLRDRNVIAIQTLRNHIMVSNNNAYFGIMMLIIFGAGLIYDTYPTLPKWDFIVDNVDYFRGKILLAMICILCSIFFFSQSSKYASDIGFILNIGDDQHLIGYNSEIESYGATISISFWLGMRFFYLSIATAFYLLGPTWFLLSTFSMISIQYTIFDFSKIAIEDRQIWNSS